MPFRIMADALQMPVHASVSAASQAGGTGSPVASRSQVDHAIRGTNMESTPQAFRVKAVAMANETQKHLNGDFAQVQAIVDDAELVVAVWQDPNEPNGVGTMLIKGNQSLREIVASDQERTQRVAAIPCVSAEQAEVLRQVAGEKDRRH
ncbi:hypothetical protein [Methylobacterium sp. 37f]|uniref:hypothetical protein n=1 Tax=Methylobacterium sp. 37f TaxID=2817058 RepID=UPI001FFD044A|nr:hypothetical protein [Methylobacterium sp. 37f]MCK2056987.1 hypothetical protein [Methylobacterium sp. 37f]